MPLRYGLELRSHPDRRRRVDDHIDIRVPLVPIERLDQILYRRGCLHRRSDRLDASLQRYHLLFAA
ncbi:MAG: hypothetical protein OXU81_20975 [Gammaproteobacteria bacterium]|nr:hypothetical protein [Gammaproteobacteria bacterium]